MPNFVKFYGQSPHNTIKSKSQLGLFIISYIIRLKNTLILQECKKMGQLITNHSFDFKVKNT
jgi:hypothetical protein